MKGTQHDDRLFAVNDEVLRRLVAEGRASGEPLDGEAAIKRLRKKYAAMTAARGRPHVRTPSP